MDYHTVLFDLDGTLADTAPDLAYALNEVLRERGGVALPYDEIRPVVSHGAMALIRLGFGFGPEEPRFATLRQRLLEIYRENLTTGTRLFPGMEAVLDGIESRGMKWGVVTNKPAWLTDPLLEQLGVAHRAAAIVSGDTLPQRKPHPAPMFLACRHARSEPSHCLFVGDAERDIEAGRNAGMSTLVALFGYLGKEDDPERWGADGMVENAAEILEWVDRDGLRRRPA
jgi:phosphoglycolate phosphatase